MSALVCSRRWIIWKAYLTLFYFSQKVNGSCHTLLCLLSPFTSLLCPPNVSPVLCIGFLAFDFYPILCWSQVRQGTLKYGGKHIKSSRNTPEYGRPQKLRSPSLQKCHGGRRQDILVWLRELCLSADFLSVRHPQSEFFGCKLWLCRCRTFWYVMCPSYAWPAISVLAW